MPPPELRPYQVRIVERVRASLRKHRRSILQSPTGSGKSIVIAYMIARAAERGMSAWLLCHRRELLDQLSDTLWEADVRHGVIMSGRSETRDPVQVASVQTLVRRLDRLAPPDMLAIDECHHATAATWKRIADHCSDSWTVGLTATPCRTDGRGLDDVFDDLVIGPTVEELTKAGYLAPYRIYAPPSAIDLTGVRTLGGDWAKGELEERVDTSSVVGDAVGHYKRLVAPGTCLVYCVSRAHARHVEQAYREAGVDARYCAGDTPKARRDAMVDGLRRGSPPVIVSVDLFGEGLDCPGLTAVQMLRPTQSLGLYLQQVGRSLRPEAGKDHAIILDHVHNSLCHGLPDDERGWTLEGRKRKSTVEGTEGPPLHHCEQCFCVFPKSHRLCPLCGWEPQVEVQLPDHVDGELVEVDKEAVRRQRRSEEGRARGLEALVQLAIRRGYKPGWAAHRHAARTRGNVGALKQQEYEIRRSLRSSS